MNKQLIIKIAWDRFEKQWRFESISYNGEKLLPIEDSESPLPRNARVGVNALCLLGVAEILDQMNPEKVGHSEAIRELLSPIWNGKKNKWLKTLFGPKGFQEALVEYEQNRKPSVKLASHVEVRFIPPKSSEKKLPTVLEEIIEQRLHRHQNSLRSGLEIRLITPCQVISSFDQEGKLEEGEQLKIEVHCKESEHLFVAWLTCFGKEPVELYPINSLKMKLTLLKASFENIILRFALMMGLVILGMFANMEWLMILALPVFISALLAIKIEFKKSDS